jgi:hypothetical protein
MNWGTKIIIGMALFMAFIMAMAAKMVLSGAEDDLVEKNYYEKGLQYDQSYNLQSVAVSDSVVPTFEAAQDHLIISFKSAPEKYKLLCLRPSDSKLDFVYQGAALDNKKMLVSREKLKSGPWNFHLEFTINDKEYLVERQMTIQ